MLNYHYHVGHGLGGGYLFDSITSFDRKKDAERYAYGESLYYREMNYDASKEDRYKIMGSMKTGYYITFGIGGSRVIEIWKCSDTNEDRDAWE